jgi:hypothetical protein
LGAFSYPWIVLSLVEVFLSNKKGFPVLSKSHQRVVGRFMDLGAQIILSCEDMDNPSLKEPFWYKEYLGFLKAKMVKL